MDRIFYLLLGVGLLVALVTGIVHLASSLFRFLLGGSMPSESTSACCPRCATFLMPGATHCKICAWPESLARGDRSYLIRAELEARLLHYQQLNLLKSEEVQAWLASLRAEPLSTSQPSMAELVPWDSTEERQQRESQNSAATAPLANDSSDPILSADQPRGFDEPLPRPIVPTADVDDPFRLTMPGQI